ncbi:hypothetical protein ACQJBY_004544 [Aegilops geniculata]
MSMLACALQTMGSSCSRPHSVNEAEAADNTRSADIDRRILQETKADQHVHKLLLLGAGESGKSTIFKQIKLLFRTGFDEAELKGYTPVIHANVFQTIKILYDGAKELAQVETESSKHVISSDNQFLVENCCEGYCLPASHRMPYSIIEIMEFVYLWFTALLSTGDWRKTIRNRRQVGLPTP